MKREKLCAEDVIVIRWMWKAGKLNQKELAHIFKVDHSNIHAIVNRKSWKKI